MRLWFHLICFMTKRNLIIHAYHVCYFGFFLLLLFSTKKTILFFYSENKAVSNQITIHFVVLIAHCAH